MGDGGISDDGHAERRLTPKSVLIVEDNFIIALDAEVMLRELGIEIVWSAASIPRALEIVARERPQFVLLDVNLGEEKSFEVAQRLRELGIPFAFGTGYGSPHAFPEGFANIPIVTKPYSLERLEAVLAGAP